MTKTNTYYKVSLIVECDKDKSSGKDGLKRFLIESFMYLHKFYPSFKILSIEELSEKQYYEE